MGNDFSYTPNTTKQLKTRITLTKQTEEEKYEWPRAEKDPKYFQGKYDTRPDARSLAPFFHNPFTEVWEDTMNLQHHPMCGNIELGMMNCLEAYGLPQGNYKCRDLMDDYFECITETKRFKRIKVMRRERARQYRDGEREFKYAMPPKPGSYEL